MKVFLTGATGYIGSVIAEKLLLSGHQVTSLARSESSASALRSKNIGVIYGDLQDLDVLAKAAGESDGVIHAGFKQSEHGFADAMAAEREVVLALIHGLGDSAKPFIYTGGTGMLGDTDSTVFDEKTPDRFKPGEGAGDTSEMRRAGMERMETESRVLAAKGVRGIVLRPPNVYGRSNGHGLISFLMFFGQKIGAVAYADFSAGHLWSFVHVDDLADLYVLALEKSSGGELYYASSESGIPTRALAEAISRGIGTEGRTAGLSMAELTELFDNPFMSEFWSWNNQSSAEKARRLLGWEPTHMQMPEEIAGRVS